MKNLKKGLAVAMSLAMITTVMPTNVNAADVNDSTSCVTADKSAHFAQLDKLDEMTNLKLEEATRETKITLGSKEQAIATLITSDANFGVYADALTYFTANRETDAWYCATTDAEYKANKAAAQDVLDILTLFGAATVEGSINFNLDMINITAIDEIHTKAKVEAAIKFLEDNADHLTDREAAQAAAYTLKAEKAIANYDKNNTDLSAVEAVAKIKEIVVDNTGLTAAVDTNNKLTITGVTEFDYKGLKVAVAEVEKLVDGLKSDVRRNPIVKAAVKVVTDAFEKAEDAGKYTVVIDDFFTELEDLRETTLSAFEVKITAAIATAVKLTAGNKADYGVNELDVTVANASVYVIDVEDVIAQLGSVVNSDVIDALNSIVDGLEDFVTISTESTGRRYNVYMDEGDYFAYLGNQTSLAVDLAQILMAPTFKDGKLTGNTLVETLEDSLEDVTADYNKVIKATKLTDTIEDLYHELKDSDNLTSEEKAKLHMAYYKLKGITGQVGWVDLGNGNWDFFNEDGTPATKWVAAGKLWYFVKDGHMLRNSWVAQDATGNVWYYVNGKGEMVVNTTIDGYAINANGEWHKK